MRKILAVTGIRADYDLMVPVFKAIDAHDDLELKLIVTGAHCSPHFGQSMDIIKEDGFCISEVIETLIDGDRDISRLKSAAVQMMGLSQTFDRERPDIVLLLGDREEVITSAICATYLGIPIAHVSGGDRTVGNADDQVRHAVSKFAHIHFPTSMESAKRLESMGEEAFRIHFSGHPGIDRMRSEPELSKAEVLDYYGFPVEDIDKPLFLLIQHVMSSEYEHAYCQMKETLEALKEMGCNTIIGYPNSDAGSRDIIRCIGEYHHVEFFRTAKYIPRTEFMNTLRHVDCILGNSSLGVMEASFFKKPVIDIGNRQKTRQHTDNVLSVKHDKKAILKAIEIVLKDEAFIQTCSVVESPFGDGYAAEKIVSTLTEVGLDERLLRKDIVC